MVCAQKQFINNGPWVYMVYIFNSELNQLLWFCIIVFYSRVNYNDIF